MDFNKPELQDHYAALLSRLRSWVVALAGWLEDATPEHMPAGTKRWSQINQRFERFDGTTWQPLAKQYRINVDQVGGRETGNGADQIPLNNGQLNHQLNAEQLGGQVAAYYASQTDMQARVAKAGDTMTGPLILAGDASETLQAVTKQQLEQAQHAAIPADGSVTGPKLAPGAVTADKLSGSLSAPRFSVSSHEYMTVEAAQANADARIARAGDTMTGPLKLAGEATEPLQAVTKQQLDDAQQAAIPADGSVTGPKLAPGAVTADKLSGPLGAPRFSVSSREYMAVGNGKVAKPIANNLAIRSHFGIGLGPSLDGYSVPSDEYSHWFNTRDGDAGLRGRLHVGGAWVYLPSANGNGTIRSLHHNDDTIGFVGREGGWVLRVHDNGDLWTPAFGWLRGVLYGKANAGAECQHNSGVWEFAAAAYSPPHDAPAPWVLVGLRIAFNRISNQTVYYMRAIKLRNQ